MDTKVLIVEDDRLIRQGLVRLLRSEKAKEKKIKVVGDIRDAVDLFVYLKNFPIDIVLLDMKLNHVIDAGLNILSKIEKFNANKKKQTKVLFLSAEVTDADLIIDALNKGAIGFLGKDIDEDDLIQNLVDAHRGVISDDFTSTEVARTLAKFAKNQNLKSSLIEQILTKRELEVFKLFASGLNRAEVKEHLGVGFAAVDMHKKSIKEKTGLDNSVLYLRWIYQNSSDWLPAVFELNPAIQAFNNL